MCALKLEVISGILVQSITFPIVLGETGAWVFRDDPEDMFREFFGSTSPFAEYFGRTLLFSLELCVC